MADNVFILGAGASREGGAPLMQDFLDRARQFLDSGDVIEWKQDFETVFKAIGQLQAVHSKAEMDIVNIESVLEAFAMASLLDIEPFNDPVLERSMQRLIAVTLEQSLRFPVSNDGNVFAPHPYPEFCQILHRLENQENSTSAILTFNYDCCLDFGFYAIGRNIDYSLSSNKPDDSIPLLKLHGSLNWYKEKDQDLILCTDMNTFLNGRRPVKASSFSVNWVLLKMTEIWAANPDFTLAHMFVPPSSNKSAGHWQLRDVWRSAAKHLSEARNIIVLGYSLPKTDSFFRYLYALGSIGKAPLERFWVFDPDPSGEVESRFRNMLGPGARDRFRYGQLTFSDAIEIIDDTIKNQNPNAFGKWWR